MHTYAKLLVFNEAVIIMIYYLKYKKIFTGLNFPCNVSVGLVCIFTIFFVSFDYFVLEATL